MVGDQRSGAHLAVGELGVLVDVAPPGDDLRLDRAQRAIDVRAP